VVIGGTLLSGGVGFMAGTAMGVLILGLIQIIISYQNLNSWWTYIVVGALLLLFILLQNVVSSASSRMGGKGHKT
jgi:simple sugar transport system permease protein